MSERPPSTDTALAEAPASITIQFCATCGRNDLSVAFTGKSHWRGGQRCSGQPKSVTYVLASRASSPPGVPFSGHFGGFPYGGPPANEACICPNRDTVVGNCPVHGDKARLAAPPVSAALTDALRDTLALARDAVLTSCCDTDICPDPPRGICAHGDDGCVRLAALAALAAAAGGGTGT